MSISRRDRTIIEQLFEISKNVKSLGRSKHAAALVHRGKIVSIGVNDCKTDPWNLRFTTNTEKIWRHAETTAIKVAVQSTRDLEMISRCHLYVVRCRSTNRGRNFQYAESFPCGMCFTAARRHQIRRIVYTVDAGIKEVRF